MNLSYIRIGFLCTATVFAPSLSFAQMGSTPNQPLQPQQQPGSMPGGAGMAGSMAASAGGETEDQMMMDKMFVHKALEGGLGEIQLGQLASQKASNEDVKALGQKMVDEHTALNNDMKPIADTMGVHVPTKPGKQDQAELDKLNGLSGTDFDKEYLAYVDKSHHKDLGAFRTEARSTTDPTLKEAVEKAEKIVWRHTKMVDQLAQANSVPIPEHGKH